MFQFFGHPVSITGDRSGCIQRRCAIEALEARAPPDIVATLVNSLQNLVKSITLCVILNANIGKIVLDSPYDTMHSD